MASQPPNPILSFDTNPLRHLDKFALLACQPYNFGNDTDWFGCFRGGVNGFMSRLMGVRVHYHDLHTWVPPRVPPPYGWEWQVASTLFNMESAIECVTFALNALGFAVKPNAFRSVSNRRALRHIAPNDILKVRKGAYDELFPSLAEYWRTNSDLLEEIAEQHEVSKHREGVFSGGQLSTAPAPDGFFEALGVTDDVVKLLLAPHEQIILRKDPKAPKVPRVSTPRSELLSLEVLAQRFTRFIDETCARSLADATARIDLPVKEFRE